MRRRSNIATDGLAERWQMQRANPWRGMTPEMLARAFDEFDAGWLRRAALMWDNRAERDEVLAANVPKRCSAVSRLPWSIIATDESRRARRHVEALQEFFDRGIEATDALYLDHRGGMRLLIEQMMDAVFTGTAVHEIIWRPGRNDVSAELRFVPLYFFERLSGRLRYTGPEMTTRGQDLEPGGWMVAYRRRALMKAALLCCLFKALSLSDWISFSERFGQPGLHGSTSATAGSPEWDAAQAALESFAQEWAMLTNKEFDLELIQATGSPNAPYEPMVERMTRMLIILCRGADLGTLSNQDGAGASLQGDESDIVIEDDCQMVSEALQRYLARPVIRHLFGEEPLAYIEVQAPSNEDALREIQIDERLSSLGVRQDPEALAERYGRTIAAAPAVAPAENDAAVEPDETEVLAALSDLLRQAISEPARERLYDALREALLAEDESMVAALEKIRANWGEFLRPDPAAEAAFERFAAAATIAGWLDGENRPGMAMQIHADAPGTKNRDNVAEAGDGPNEAQWSENDSDRAEAIPRRGFWARVRMLLANRYDPTQPRAPKGSREGGQWVSKGAVSSKGRAARRVAMRPANPEDRKRLKIPAGFTDVQVASKPGADLVATARNANGKTVYFYSEEYARSQAAAKYRRIEALHKDFPKIVSRVDADIEEGGANAQSAMKVRMIMKTGLRNGGTSGGGKVAAYGASSLRMEHVRTDGDRVHLDFIGKKGVRQRHSFTDAAIANHVRARAAAGKRTLWDKGAGDTLRYLKSVTGDKYKVHDLRTYYGTRLADAAVAKMEARGPIDVSTPRQLMAAKRRVGKIVGRALGNDASMSLKSYIHPAVFSGWDAAASQSSERELKKSA